METIKKNTESVKVAEDDMIRVQNELINTLQSGIALREQIIDRQRKVIELLREDLCTKRQWWKFWKL